MEKLKNLDLWRKRISGRRYRSKGSHLDVIPDLSPESSLPIPFPDGVKVLHDCPDATVDICFIHGLSGNRDSTWTADGHATPWPEAFLPSKLRARILTYGYDAYVMRASIASSNRIIDHATNLLSDLTNDRSSCNALSRPLLFVAHSLGGLVCKEAILLSRNHPEPHLRGIFTYTAGIIFMGTPHKGSWMAEWGNIPASALLPIKSINTSLLEILQTSSQVLELIQINFWSMIRERQSVGSRLEVTCIFEELPLPIVGKIVPKSSATLEGYHSISIHANHRDMVKFSSEEDNGFKRVLGELMRWESQIRFSGITLPTRLAEGQSHTLPKVINRPNVPGRPSFHQYGSGNIITGNTENTSSGSGNQFPGATFTGSVNLT